MSLCRLSGTLFLTIFLVASALDGPKLDVTEQSFAKAESEIKSIMQESEKKIAPEDDALKGLANAVKTLEKMPDKLNAADVPKNPRSTVNSRISSFVDEHAKTQGYTDKKPPPGKLIPASFAQVADESDESEDEAEDEDEDEAGQSEDEEEESEGGKEDEEEEDERENEHEEEQDGEGGEDEEENANEGDGNEEDDEDEEVTEEDEEDGKEHGDGEERDAEEMEWGKVPDSAGLASLVDDENGRRKLMTRRDEHRRRGVPDMPFPTEAPMEAVATETTTTTGHYPLGYVGPGHEAVEKDYKDKWAVMPDPEGREMTKAWSFDHPIDYHEHEYDGKPGRCDGRRRKSPRRRVCAMSHRRRRGHRRRRRHHRRRSHEYRRRRRRVHRRRRISKADKSHRRRSHRRRLDRGDAAATSKIAARKASRSTGTDSKTQSKMKGQVDDSESLFERNGTQMDWKQAAVGSDMDEDTMGIALTSQDQSALMRRHNFDID